MNSHASPMAAAQAAANAQIGLKFVSSDVAPVKSANRIAKMAKKKMVTVAKDLLAHFVPTERSLC